MRTAESIIKQYKPNVEYNSYYHINNIEKMINEARKEAIEECAERAKSEWIRWGTNMGHAVDKQSILSLINEIE